MPRPVQGLGTTISCEAFETDVRPLLGMVVIFLAIYAIYRRLIHCLEYFRKIFEEFPRLERPDDVTGTVHTSYACSTWRFIL